MGKWIIEGYLVRNFTGSNVSMQRTFIREIKMYKLQGTLETLANLINNHRQYKRVPTAKVASILFDLTHYFFAFIITTLMKPTTPPN